jgi:hypothetical protein
MEKNNLFDTKENRERCVIVLQQLVESEGWLIVSTLMQANIDEFSEKILDDNEIPDEERRDLIVRRAYMKKLVDWPMELISRLQEDAVSEDSLDPYHQVKNNNQ